VDSGKVASAGGGFCLSRVRSEHFPVELGGPEGDFVEVAVEGFQCFTFPALLALAALRSFAKGREERLPILLRIRGIGMVRVGMGVGGHDRRRVKRIGDS